MTGKLPADAFAFYVALGDDRSYQAVADRFGVLKKAVTRKAVREDWAGRLAKIEEHARQELDRKLGETIETMHERHLKMIQMLQMKAVAALRSMSLDSAMDAARTLDLAIRQERLIRGEPTERQALSVEETLKKQHRRWLGGADTDDASEGADEDDDWDALARDGATDAGVGRAPGSPIATPPGSPAAASNSAVRPDADPGDDDDDDAAG